MSMTQLTDEQYFNLADKVYEDKYLKPGQTIISDTGNDWVVINSVNDPSGLQSIAVVPLKDYRNMQSGKIKDYPNVIFLQEEVKLITCLNSIRIG